MILYIQMNLIGSNSEVEFFIPDFGKAKIKFFQNKKLG